MIWDLIVTGAWDFSVHKMCKLAVGPKQHPTWWVQETFLWQCSGYVRLTTQLLQVPRLILWSSTASPPHALKMWRLIKYIELFMYETLKWLAELKYSRGQIPHTTASDLYVAQPVSLVHVLLNEEEGWRSFRIKVFFLFTNWCTSELS
jgi:hypothetical protein